MRISDWSSDVCSSDLPRAVATLARGSSDNAATFARYLIETRVGVLTSSAAPSIASVYAAAPDMTDTVMLAISQSGKSPDLVTALAAARARGAYGIALVNADAKSEEHTSELQSLMRISYAVFCLTKKKHTTNTTPP